MSYSIYIGLPEDIGNSKEIVSFSKEEHAESFILIKSIKSSYGWLSELQEYEEFINFSSPEIELLLKEIENLQKNETLKNNAFLKALLYAGKEALAKNLELMCTGGD